MTKTRRCLRLLTLLTLFANEAGAQTAVYKYVDEKGHVVYTDQPPTDKNGKVETLEIEPSNLSAPPPMAIREKPTTASNKAATPDYQTTITQPTDGETIPYGPGDFSVTARLSPPLRGNERVQLLVDGLPIGQPQRQPQWQLRNVFRGEHTLVVERLLGADQVVHRSIPSIVYVLRPSVR